MTTASTVFGSLRVGILEGREMTQHVGLHLLSIRRKNGADLITAGCDQCWMKQLRGENVPIIRQKPRARASGYTYVTCKPKHKHTLEVVDGTDARRDNPDSFFQRPASCRRFLVETCLNRRYMYDYRCTSSQYHKRIFKICFTSQISQKAGEGWKPVNSNCE